MNIIRAKAVIGAGYGDEGKGLVTDVLAAGGNAVVVRSNGGAQAGHTVVTPEGIRHVFHHVGSGALAGAPTHLSRHFVAHPMMLLDELETLGRLGADLRLSSDPRVAITTPFDVMINQAVEMARGTARHGSCGLGFGETIERNLRPEFALVMLDLFRPDLVAKLKRIRAEWVPMRLRQLGISEVPEGIEQALDDDGVIARFVEDCDVYVDRVTLWPDRRIAEKGNVIFEGAQGLLLDQDYGAFPHVTRSNTGLRNMLMIAAEAGIGAIEAVYVTRCYTTRHGAGPLSGEVGRLENIAVVDPTNAPNDWQGTLRVAPLDVAVLRDAIGHDLGLAKGIVVEAGLMVTCLDQVAGAFAVSDGGAARWLEVGDAAGDIARSVGLALRGESWGPSRVHFRPAQVERLVA